MGVASALLATCALGAEDRIPATGIVNDKITSITVLSSVDKTARVQIGFLNSGFGPATFMMVKAAGSTIDPDALPREFLVKKTGDVPDMPQARVDYYSSTNLVFRSQFWVWNPTTNTYGWKVNGTETANNVADKVQPKLSGLVDNGDGTLTASFGFTGPGMPYRILSKINHLVLPEGATVAGSLPSDFRAAAASNVFSVTFPKSKKVRWNLAGIVLTVDKGDLAPAGNA
jgi:hypothetical protein